MPHGLRTTLRSRFVGRVQLRHLADQQAVLDAPDLELPAQMHYHVGQNLQCRESLQTDCGFLCGSIRSQPRARLRLGLSACCRYGEGFHGRLPFLRGALDGLQSDPS